MSETKATVSRVEIETTDLGLEVQVTVLRVPGNLWVTGHPRPEDVPVDIREALARWLARADA